MIQLHQTITIDKRYQHFIWKEDNIMFGKNMTILAIVLHTQQQKSRSKWFLLCTWVFRPSPSWALHQGDLTRFFQQIIAKV